MSPVELTAGALDLSAPRASGDEPDLEPTLNNVAACSPRERG